MNKRKIPAYQVLGVAAIAWLIARGATILPGTIAGPATTLSFIDPDLFEIVVHFFVVYIRPALDVASGLYSGLLALGWFLRTLWKLITTPWSNRATKEHGPSEA
jgi:hypothetical protein